jgi:hypothetical protein
LAFSAIENKSHARDIGGYRSVRSIYTVPILSNVIIPDHWEIPFLGGKCKIVEEEGRAKALKITFSGEPLSNAPRLTEVSEGEIRAHIDAGDGRLTLVKRHIEQAISFLECLYNLHLATNEIEARYEAETADEERAIRVTSMKIGKADHALPLTFDMLTRAFMAAEDEEGPRFQSTLVRAARSALSSEQYIDSFRFSFLLIEAIYGNGQFKTAALKSALNRNPEFVAIVQRVIADPLQPRRDRQSDTRELLAARSNADQIIEHLIDKRGFYFHGNRRRVDAWKPHQQEAAEHLALLAVGIAQEIAQAAANPMFDAVYEERHFREAMDMGAKIVFEISFSFREPEEKFSRTGKLAIKTPGTKVTEKGANAIAQEFLRQFEDGAPAAALERASCVVQGSKQAVFDIVFHKT